MQPPSSVRLPSIQEKLALSKNIPKIMFNFHIAFAAVEG